MLADVLCAGDCHVWLGSSSLCTCEAHRVAMLFPGYNPYGPHAPQSTAPDVPQARLAAAERAGATHLSGDGETAYMLRMGRVCWADWSEENGCFGGWWESQAEELPAGVVPKGDWQSLMVLK